MNVSFFFGPEKIPFSIYDDGMIESNSIIPFHGIISRGLLNKFIEHNLNVQLWHQYVHEVLAENLSFSTPELDNILNYSKQCQVLSYAQSALCARKYTEHYCSMSGLDNPVINLLNIKEGHTSSVWKADITANEKTETFVINVARDDEAGIELKESSEKLRTIGERFPKINMAKVLDIFSLYEPSLPTEVIITRNEWVENAFEIHNRRNKTTGEDELLMVDRFITSRDRPAHITSVLGKIFSPEKTKKIQSEIKEFITQATTCLSCKTDVNINDGDVVWNGKKAVIVALS